MNPRCVLNMKHNIPSPGTAVGGLALPALAALLVLNLPFTTLFAQDTAFTYQGRLNGNGAPANGLYDFTFQAFDAPAAGNSLGGTVNVNAVAVTNGLFTALVDLDDSPFTGPARWLQISVSTNGAGSFTTLTPRQPLTPSPYAIFASTAGTVTTGAITSAKLAANSVATANIQDDAVTAGKIASEQVVKSLNGLTDAVSLIQGANVTINTVGNSLEISAPAGGLNLPFSGTASSSGSIFTLTNSGAGPAGVFLGKVGIGTTAPQANLHVRTADQGVRIQGASAGVNNTAYLTFANGAGTDIGYVGDGSVHDHSLYLGAYLGNVNLYTSFGATLTATPAGNVGIGTTAPAAKLEVRGNIRLGNSGQFFASAGEENLRIVRGGVTANGIIVSGSGFTVVRISEGRYNINFSTPFNGVPDICATATSGVAGSTRVATADVASTSLVHISISNPVGPSFVDAQFHFIAIGPR